MEINTSGVIPPMRLLALKNILTGNGEILPDAQPLDFNTAKIGTGAESFQVIGVSKWYVPDTGCYSYNGLTNKNDIIGQNLNVLI